MLKPHGYVVIADPDRPQLIERDTVTCRHCQRVVLVKPGSAATVYLEQQPSGQWLETPGACCRSCMAPICRHCEALGRCTPFERRLEAYEARMRLWASVG